MLRDNGQSLCDSLEKTQMENDGKKQFVSFFQQEGYFAFVEAGRDLLILRSVFVTQTPAFSYPLFLKPLFTVAPRNHILISCFGLSAFRILFHRIISTLPPY